MSISHLRCKNCGLERFTYETLNMMSNLRSLNLHNNNLKSFDLDPSKELKKKLCKDALYLEDATLRKFERYNNRVTELGAGSKMQRFLSLDVISLKACTQILM